MCKGEHEGRVCPYKDDCFRHTAQPSEHRQTYFANIPLKEDGVNCEYLMPNGKAPEMVEIWNDDSTTDAEKIQKSIDLLKKKFGGQAPGAP